MNIKLGDNIYLKSDSYCCWLSKVYIGKKGKSEGKEREVILGYYQNPQVALTALLGHKIRTNESTTIEELLSVTKKHIEFIENHVSKSRDAKEIRK